MIFGRLFQSEYYRKMKRIKFIGLTIWLLFAIEMIGNAQIKSIYKIYSPDKQTVMSIGLGNEGKMYYNVSIWGNELVTWSQVGFKLNSIIAGEKTTFKNKELKTVSEKFAWTLGENDSIANVYDEIKLNCKSPSIDYQFIARVFNGSVAFRYQLPEQTTEGVLSENTQFNLTSNYTIYQYHHESVFTPIDINHLNTSSDLPSTLTNGHFYLSIGEANNDNYTKVELKRGGLPNSLYMGFIRDSAVKVIGHFQTPWRTICMSKTAIGLHDFSELSLKLNPLSPNGIPAWVKPGKLIRCVTLTTQGGMDCIDFAEKNDLKYILFDGSWYNDKDFDANRAALTARSTIDMPKVVEYGKKKGIGVILYVNYNQGLRMQLDKTLQQFKDWGAVGVKFGFVDGFTQKGIAWIANAIKKVQDYGFIMNIHDNYKPTGLSRTYPHLLTQERIRGDENSPDAFHTTVLPFTRFVAGAADFTFCYPNSTNRYTKNLNVSMAQQLALSVIYFSPLQAMFWYGKPLEYTNEREIEFFKLVPTVWNESHYLAGEIGKGICVARRSGKSWFIGSAAGLEDWQDTIKLDFLKKGKSYKATVYEDSYNSISKRTEKIIGGQALPITLKGKTGQAIYITQ